mmetsp:Transcript_2742/g.8518  ORF Transcript_2742/g.8518 Transcript_2742/m.8518 type:complete len:200 (-) Transcript_2742:245-844(-)
MSDRSWKPQVTPLCQKQSPFKRLRLSSARVQTRRWRNCLHASVTNALLVCPRTMLFPPHRRISMSLTRCHRQISTTAIRTMRRMSPSRRLEVAQSALVMKVCLPLLELWGRLSTQPLSTGSSACRSCPPLRSTAIPSRDPRTVSSVRLRPPVERTVTVLKKSMLTSTGRTFKPTCSHRFPSVAPLQRRDPARPTTPAGL